MGYDEGVAMNLIGMAISLPAEWWAGALSLARAVLLDVDDRFVGWNDR